MKTAVIIGVGPELGLGAQLCRRFAHEGLHVIVAGRTPAQIEAVADSVRRAGGEATAIAADATSEADVQALFAAAGSEVDLAIYNAGNNAPGRITDMELAELLGHTDIRTTSRYVHFNIPRLRDIQRRARDAQ